MNNRGLKYMTDTYADNYNELTNVPARYFLLNNNMTILARASYINDSKQWLLYKPLRVFTDIGSKGVPELLIYAWLPVGMTEEQAVYIQDSMITYVVSVNEKLKKYIDKFSEQYYNVKSMELEEVTKTKKTSDILDLLNGLSDEQKNNNGGENNNS